LTKCSFTKIINLNKKDEDFVQCRCCGRRFHQICALHLDEVWTDGYFCPLCLQNLGKSRELNPFTAENLPADDLSDFLERKVNDFLTAEGATEGKVIIRVVSKSCNFLFLKPLVKEYLQMKGREVDDFLYSNKGVFAFQKIHGQEVCFFGFFVQEHGIESIEQNRGTVYLAYVDSVQYFRPKRYRTSTYHIILNSYFEYVKGRGFFKAYLWVCPPLNNCNYLFYKRPEHQLIPNPRRLQNWYAIMLMKAKQEGIIEDFMDLQLEAKNRKLQYLYEIPYFDGDYWPNALETILQNEKESTEEGTNTEEAFDKEIEKELYECLHFLRRDYFTITLKSHPNFSPRVETNFITSQLMNNWSSFLTKTKEAFLEFSTLRRAKVQLIWTCTVCKFFSLCQECYSKVHHPHVMLQAETGFIASDPPTSALEGSVVFKPSVRTEGKKESHGSGANQNEDTSSCDDYLEETPAIKTGTLC
uniref:histone acetyltransferase n=1 Tax=Hymenolepis diminuta TaxID=6216 RepID=A0A0R3SFR2_HYMDI